jgi:tetratricopeptide (TPR) repeat protein
MNQVDAILEQAMKLQLVAQYERAEPLYRRAVQLGPRDARAHCLLGGLLFKLGRYDEASAALRKACRLAPGYAEAHMILGNTLFTHGHWREAEEVYLRALELNPESVPMMNNLAATLQHRKKYGDAEALCRRAIGLEPNNAETHSNLSYILHMANRFLESEEEARKALDLDPVHAEACNNLAVALCGQNRNDEAEIYCRKALELNPNLWQAHVGLSNIMKKTRRTAISVEAARRAVEIQPDNVFTQDMLGLALLETDAIEEAEQCFRRALDMDPEEGTIWSHVASALRQQARFEEAVPYDRKALELKTDEDILRFNFSLDLLALGQLEEGWKYYEFREAMVGLAHRYKKPRWSGEPGRGSTLLVHVEQGLGDTLQFLRFLPLVKARFLGRVVLECQSEMVALLSGIAGVDELIERPRDLGPPPVDHDVQISQMSLPAVLGIGMAGIPETSPKLNVPKDRVEKWRQRFASHQELKVGIRWAGNVEFLQDFRRSVHLRELAPLAGTPGVQLFSLQMDAAARQLDNPPDGLSAIDLSSELHDLQDTAAALMNLDLLISTDTSVPHLAGVLGRPTWIALPISPDWRWVMGGKDRPIWYPSVRMFRRSRSSDWRSVFEQVACELRKVAEAHSRGEWPAEDPG